MKLALPFSVALFLALLLAGAATARAEVQVTIGFDPIEPSSSGVHQTAPDAFGDRGVLMAAGEVWYINYFEADLSQVADATLWAVRNEGATPVDITVNYFDTTTLTPTVTEMFTIPVHGVKTRNSRDVEGLPADLDGFARGRIQFNTDGPVSVDFFQLIASQDFATSDLAGTFDEVCFDLSFRFIDFGGDRGSVASFQVGSPLGADPGDPPTLSGNVYDESGDFINSFVVRTEQYSFLLDIRSFVLPGTSFGSIELDATNGNGAIAYVTHSASGRFSVSNSVFCRDAPPLIL